MAHVTIPDQDSFVTYTSQTGTGPFTVPFAVFEKADITVLVDGEDVGQAGFSYTATSSTTGGYQTGTVTLSAAIVSKDVTIFRDINPKRTTDMGVGPQNRDALNSAFDRVHALLQDSQRDVGRTLRSQVGNVFQMMPAKADLANKFLAFDEDGEPVAAVMATTTVAINAAWLTELTGAPSATDVTADLGTSSRSLAERFTDYGGHLWDFITNLSDRTAILAGSSTTDFSTQVQAAVNACAGSVLHLPRKGLVFAKGITISSSLAILGPGRQRFSFRRPNASYNNLFYASAIDDLYFRGFTTDGNAANNQTVSGSHGGFRLQDNCSRFVFDNVGSTNWYGNFSGSEVGGGIGIVGGSHGRLVNDCYTSGNFDGISCSGHTDLRDYGSRHVTNRRFGELVAASSHRFEHHGVTATGNGTAYAGAGVLIIDSTDCKGYGGTFNDNPSSHGLQHNGADRCEVHGGTFNNNGISGLDFFDSIDGKVFGGYAASNTVRGIEIDSASNGCIVTGFQASSNGDVDISVFRSADVQLNGCEGNVRAWDSGSVSTAAVSAGGTGYGVGNVLTLVGGTGPTPATLTVSSVSAGVITGVTVSNAGNYNTFPAEPVAVTGGAGTGATFTIVGLAEASNTCPRLQINGGHRSDTILLVTDACSDVRLADVKAATITDQSNEIVSAPGCLNFVMPKIALTLQNSWVAYDAAWQEPVYWRSSERKVRVQGSIKNGTTTASTVIGTLPTGYRPAKVEGPFLGFASGGTVVAVFVNTNGQITAQTALNATLTVVDIEFDVAA